jgi:sulfiredoxin
MTVPSAIRTSTVISRMSAHAESRPSWKWGEHLSRGRSGRWISLAKLANTVHASPMLTVKTLAIASIRVPAKRRKTLEADKVLVLAEDILENGQLTPIRVRKDGDGFVLIEGYHRLEALLALGEETIEGYTVKARLH